jgi:hypothetical protein
MPPSVKRRSFQIHLSTAILATLAAGALLGVNFWPERVQCATIMDFYDGVIASEHIGPATKSENIKELNARVGEAWQLQGDADLKERRISYDALFNFSIGKSGWPLRALYIGGAFDGPKEFKILSSANGVGNERVIVASENAEKVTMNVTNNYDYDYDHETVTGTVNYTNTFVLNRSIRVADWKNLAIDFGVGLLIVASIIAACEILIRRREARRKVDVATERTLKIDVRERALRDAIQL